ATIGSCISVTYQTSIIISGLNLTISNRSALVYWFQASLILSLHPSPLILREINMLKFFRRLLMVRKTAERVRSPRTELQVNSLEDRVVPAVFNVNSTADILSPATGVVTLRSAIEAANATPGGNTINLTVTGDYKITLPGSPGEEDNAAGEFAI